jgi:hypothetical protein
MQCEGWYNKAQLRNQTTVSGQFQILLLPPSLLWFLNQFRQLFVTVATRRFIV